MKNKIIIISILLILAIPDSYAQNHFRNNSQTKDSPKQRSQEEIEWEREKEKLHDKEYRKRMEKEEKDRKRFYEETAKEEEIRRIKEDEKESLRLELEQLRKERDDSISAREKEERELKQRRQEMEERLKREQAYKEAEERRKKRREAEELLMQKEALERKEERLREAEAEIFKAQEESRNQRRETKTEAREQYVQSKINQDPLFADVYNGIMLANSLKLSIPGFFLNYGKWPERNSDLGLPDEYYVGFIQISVLPENAIEIKFKTKELMDKTVELHVRVDNGVFIWECSGGTLEKERRPKECVN